MLMLLLSMGLLPMLKIIGIMKDCALCLLMTDVGDDKKTKKQGLREDLMAPLAGHTGEAVSCINCVRAASYYA
jgi:hypothetical protein